MCVPNSFPLSVFPWQEMTPEGGHVSTLGDGIIKHKVSCVTASSALIVIGTVAGVLVFDMPSRALLRSFRDNMVDCLSLRITPDGGHILLAENCGSYYPDQLSLVTLTGECVRIVGDCVLSRAADIELASNGDIVVADSGICVFSSDGATLLRSFGYNREESNFVHFPVALAVHGEVLYVLDWTSTEVLVFK